MTERVDWCVVDDECGTFRWGYAGEDLVAESIGVLTLRATHDGDLKALEPAPGASRESVEKARRGVATAFLRAQRQQHSLHASAVSWRGEALLCVGESGSGKSTLAERLCRRDGMALLSDDIAAIELLPAGWHVLPSEGALWLSAGGTDVKIPAQATTVARDPALLRWVVSLAFNDAISVLDVRDLRGAGAASALLRSLIRFQTSPALFERQLDVVSGLVSQTHMLKASRSHDVRAETVTDALVAFVAEEAR